ncbi:MAG: ATP-grasp domain-containing protein [Bacillaceae bacterium]|nr:ATP-grasp domain-containing protein [Bacillaceae bacterium]
MKTGEVHDTSIPFTYPFVLKEVEGRGGQHVYLVHSNVELESLLPQLTAHTIIVQKLGAVPGKDVRVFVIGHEIIGATLRTSSSSFKANVSLGGTSSLYKLSTCEKELVHKIIHLFKGQIGFVGIDFLFGEDGELVFNEIEDVVGSRTLSANSTINVVQLYLKHIEKAASRD